MICILKLAGKRWYERDMTTEAAAVSYYMVFAMAPLLFMTILMAGLMFGRDYILEVLYSWGSVLGPEVLELLSLSIFNFEMLTQTISIPIVGVVFFSTMVVIMFNVFTTGLHKMWGVDQRGFQNVLSKSVRSVAFVLLLQVFVLALVIIGGINTFATQLMPESLIWFTEFILTMVLTAILFTVGYGVLSWANIPFRYRFIGGCTAAALFTIAKLLVALYVLITPVPSLFGAAGLMVVILIWVYVATAIIYYGAAVAKAAEEHAMF